MGIGEDIRDAFIKPFKPLIDFGEAIPKGTKELGSRFKNFGDGLKDIFEGVGDQVVGVGKGIELGFKDVGLLIEYLFIFLGSYLACGVYFLTQIRNCGFYYFLELIGQVLYLPIRIFAWFLKTIVKVNIYPYLNKFWRFMEKMDIIIYKHAKFHIMHYPRSIREQCYVCKRLKKEVITRQSNTVNSDFAPAPDGNIYKKIMEYGEKLNRGVEEMKYVFRSPFL